MYMCALISYSGKDSLYVSDSHLYFVVGMLILWSRVAIPGTRFRPSMYLLPAWLELDRQQGHEGRGRSPAGPRCHSPPTPGPHQSIDIAGSGAPETSQNGQWRGLVGERDRESAMADRPPDDGPGNCRAPLPVRRRWTIGQRRARVGAQNGCSSWVSCAVTHVKTQTWSTTGDAITDRHPDAMYRRPKAHLRTRPGSRPTSQWSFLFPIKADWSGRVCTAGPSVLTVISARWQRFPLPRPWWSKQAIDW